MLLISIAKRITALLVLIVLVLTGCASGPEVKRDRALARARDLIAKKDYSRAILECRNAIQAAPKDAEAHYQMGLALLGTNNLGPAVAMLRKAVELDPKHNAAQLKIAQIMASTSDGDLLREARTRLNALLQSDSSNPDTIQTLALTDLRLGEVEHGIEKLERTLAQFPRHLASSITLAKVKLRQKDAKGAEEVLKKAREQDPKAIEPLLALGEFYMAYKRMPEAEQEFRKAIGLDPESDIALYDLGTVLNALSRKQEAEQYFKHLADSSDVRYRPVYARFLFSSDRRDESVREFERQHRASPNNRQFRTYLISAYKAVNRDTEAERLLAEALKKNAKDDDALMQRAELYLEAGQSQKAEMDLHSILRLNPTSAEAHYVLARVHRARGSRLSERQELSEAIRHQPGFLRARLELAELLISAKAGKSALQVLNESPEYQKNLFAVNVERNWALLATGEYAALRKGIDAGLAVHKVPDLLIQQAALNLHSKDFKRARASIEEALQSRADDLRALTLLTQVYAAEKLPAAGIQKLGEYAAKSPKSAPVQHLLGLHLRSHAKPAEARAAFEAAKSADGSFLQADLALADLDTFEGKHVAARMRLEKLLAARPDNVLIRLHIADIDLKEKKHDAAIQQYRAVLQQQPDNTVALNNLAGVLADTGKDLNQALAYAQKVKERVGDNYAIDDTLGWAFYQKGMYAAALKHLELAAKSTTHPVIQYHLGMAYVKAGEREKGERVLALAFKVAPDIPEAALARQMVKK